MNWFDNLINGNKISGSAFQKIAQATDKVESAKGKFIAIEAAHNNIGDSLRELKDKADSWHSKLDTMHASLDSVINTL